MRDAGRRQATELVESTAGTPTSSGSRRLDIQGLRAVAVTLVVAFHAGLPVPGGFLGVDMFFVISGFVITSMLARELASRGRLSLRRFYFRRFKRLSPALALTVSVTVLLSLALQSPLGTQQITAQTALGALLLSANLVIARNTGGYFDPAADTNPLLNTWSLSVEEQFYLVFPTILIVGWFLARRTRWRWPLVLVSLVSLASFCLAAVQYARGGVPFVPESLVGFYGPLTRGWEFGAGALLALIPHYGRGVSLVVRNSLAAIGVVLVAASVLLVTPDNSSPSPATILTVAGTAMLLLSGSMGATSISRLLSTRHLVRVGDLSYSWYLWHWPLIVFAGLIWGASPLIALTAAVGSLVPAYSAFRWIEDPVRRMTVTEPSQIVALVSLAFLVPVGLSIALWFSAANGFWRDAVRSFQVSVLNPHAAADRGCIRPPTDPLLAPGTCQWGTEWGGRPVYLVGDSNADHFSDSLVEVATELQRPLRASLVGGCPFADVRLSKDDSPGSALGDGCEAYMKDTLAWLAAQPPGDVVISSSASYWIDPRYAAGTSEGDLTSSEPEKAAALREGLEVAVEEVRAAGHDVILARPVPILGGPEEWDPRLCTFVAILSGTCEVTEAESALAAIQSEASSAVEETAAVTGAKVFDPWAALCVNGACSTNRGGSVLYRDGGHISVEAGTLMTPGLLALLR